MKKTVFFLLVLTSFAGNAQDAALKENLRKLALITVDMEELERRKDMLGGYSVEADKREAFNKEYDAGVNALLEECEKFYSAEYTPDEIRELVAFYETPAGKKLAHDNMKLLSCSFPEGKEWDMQLYAIKKKDKEKKAKKQ